MFCVYCEWLWWVHANHMTGYIINVIKVCLALSPLIYCRPHCKWDHNVLCTYMQSSSAILFPLNQHKKWLNITKCPQWLNVDYEASYASSISRGGFVVFFPLCVFEELLWDVLGSSLVEEIFGEFPKFPGCVFWWSRHGVSLVLMWRAAARSP